MVPVQLCMLCVVELLASQVELCGPFLAWYLSVYVSYRWVDYIPGQMVWITYVTVSAAKVHAQRKDSVLQQNLMVC